MRYLVIGAGGAGSTIAGYLAREGYAVDVIARGEQLRGIKENGLFLENTRHGDFRIKMDAFSMDDYPWKADVIFLCVKRFSLPEIIPRIVNFCAENALVVPIQNGIGVGDEIRNLAPELDCLDSCLYISTHVVASGLVRQEGKVFRLICADHTSRKSRDEVELLANEWRKSGIDVKLTDTIQRDQFRKFMFISPLAAAQILFDSPVGRIQEASDCREALTSLIRELEGLAAKLDYTFPVDMVEDGLKRVDTMPKFATSSLFLDLQKGKETEVQALILDPIRLGEKYGLPMSRYRMVAEKLGYGL